VNAAWLSEPLLATGLTLVAYQLAVAFYRRSGWLVAQPVMVAVALIVAVLLVAGVDYPTYRRGAEPISVLIGPATVALALPLYRHVHRIRRLLAPVLITLAAGGLLSVTLTVTIAWLLGAPAPVLASIAPKSVTMPIAMLVAEQGGGFASLAAMGVMVTGVIGAALGPWLFRLAKVDDPAARGLSYGMNAHAIGTARALEEGEECAAFSALGMGLLGIAIAILLPLAERLFR
jgi:predicted murein hydrolase (TIGR00659 family)